MPAIMTPAAILVNFIFSPLGFNFWGFQQRT